MELWDIYSRDHIKIGTDFIRGDKLKDGQYHLCAEVLVKHVDGTYLLMKRSYEKEQFGGYYVYQDKEILDKMISIEKEYNVKVYAITHEYTEFGELYDFLVVTEYPEEWNTLVIKNKNTASVFAYVWNKDCEWYSEFGSIGIQCFGGGIRRIN